MITLITIFYSFLFSINTPVQPDCENKLKELNYTYEYNQEPAVMHHSEKIVSRYSRYRIDTISREMVLKINSMYNCFKSALEADTNKVLLISYYPLYQKKNKVLIPERIHQIRYIKTGRIVDYHHLKNYKIYSNTFEKEPNPTSKYKIELLDKNNSKLISSSTKFWEECKDCPF